MGAARPPWGLPLPGRVRGCGEEGLPARGSAPPHLLLATRSNAKHLPAEVSEAVTAILQREGRLSGPEAAAYLARLERTRRFQTETWA